MKREIVMGENRDFKGVWIPKELYTNLDLSWNEKIILIEISSLSHDGECFASNQHFADMLGVSRKQVERLISGLKAKGYIKGTIIYKEGSKEVDKRVLRVVNPHTYLPEPIEDKKQEDTPPPKNEGTPPLKNEGDKNTVIKNTLNNKNCIMVRKPHNTKFNIDIVKRQIRSICEEDYPYTNIEEVQAIIETYCCEYLQRTGKEHPRLKNDNLKRIIRVMHNFGCDYGTFSELINEYFESNYSKDIDYNMNHFFTEGVLQILNYKMA